MVNCAVLLKVGLRAERVLGGQRRNGANADGLHPQKPRL